jgi:hypothetical protein
MPKFTIKKEEKGQVLVILAVSLMVLLIFIGLAIDGTQLFLNYTRLKRAVDAAAIAAANDFKRGSSLDRMTSAAEEILTLHQVDITTINFKIYMCDMDGNGERDPSLLTEVPAFYNMCPAPGQLQKKLIYIRAYENSPTYFVQLVGIFSVPISTTAVAEAAPIDLVLVMDTSESMGNVTANTAPNNPADFDPAACNTSNTCEPLRSAKNAAKFLIKTLYPGYDRVSIVTFDSVAQLRFSFTDPADLGDVSKALAAIDTKVTLHDDPPSNKLFASWDNAGSNGGFNPVDPEDRNNDGLDSDTATAATRCTDTTLGTADRWDFTKNAPTGIPCDDPAKTDAFDMWNEAMHAPVGTIVGGVVVPRDNLFTAGANCTTPPYVSDNCLAYQWKVTKNPEEFAKYPNLPMSLVSTCSGCGIRMATEQLAAAGRTNAVWVMVFLSDGVANMTDTPTTYPYSVSSEKGIPSNYPNGFCGGSLDPTYKVDGINYWQTNCIKPVTNTKRYCLNDPANTCPLSYTGHTVVALRDGTLTPPYSAPFSPPYGPEDYAMDMTDAAALRSSSNINEKLGYDIAIYSIGFGSLAVKGEPLLRYMAAVGDDGNRLTDPCSSTPSQKSCGQYYFASTVSDLMAVFQDIASRIYTKISE